jgi:hypothetical protein
LIGTVPVLECRLGWCRGKPALGGDFEDTPYYAAQGANMVHFIEMSETATVDGGGKR